MLFFYVDYSVHYDAVNSSFNTKKCTILYVIRAVFYVSCYMFRRYYIGVVRELGVGVSSLKVAR